MATAILCDVRDSRKIPDRNAFREQLHGCLQDLNSQPQCLLARFEEQAGIDEFAGIALTENTGTVISKLWFCLYPQVVRCSVVTGELDILSEPAGNGDLPAAQAFDGPAFHRAADQLQAMHDTDQLFCYHSQQQDQSQNAIISALGDLLYAQMLNWTKRQYQTASSYLQHGSQSTAATSLGISQSAVSRSLASIQFERFSRTLAEWKDAFRHFHSDGSS